MVTTKLRGIFFTHEKELTCGSLKSKKLRKIERKQIRVIQFSHHIQIGLLRPQVEKGKKMSGRKPQIRKNTQFSSRKEKLGIAIEGHHSLGAMLLGS